MFDILDVDPEASKDWELKGGTIGKAYTGTTVAELIEALSSIFSTKETAILIIRQKDIQR